MSNAKPTKVTLAELRREAARVFGPGHGCRELFNGIAVEHKRTMSRRLILSLPGLVSGNAYRRHMLALLRALPDGAMK